MAGLPYIFTNVGNPEIDATQVNADFNYVLNNATATAVASGADLTALGIYNVKHYGAKIDGTTDDGPALQLAVNAAAAAGGGIVAVKAGTSIIATGVNWASGVKLLGAGPGATILKIGTTFTAAAGATGNAARAMVCLENGGAATVPTVGAIFEDVTFDLTNQVGSSGTPYYGIHQSVHPVRNASFNRIGFELGAHGIGVQLEGLGAQAASSVPSYGIFARNLYAHNGGGVFLCYANPSGAGIAYYDVLVDGVISEVDLSVDDDRVAIIGQYTGAGQSELHGIIIRNVITSVSSVVTGGLVNGVKIDTGTNTYVHDVIVDGITYLGSPNGGQGRPFSSLIEGGGNLQDMTMRNVFARNCQGVRITIAPKDPSLYVLDAIKLLNCIDTVACIEFFDSSGGRSDEVITISNFDVYSTAAHSGAFPIGVMLSGGGNGQGASGKVVVRDGAVNGVSTGLSNNLLETGATYTTAWTGVRARDINLSATTPASLAAGTADVRNCDGASRQGTASITVGASPWTYTNSDNVPEVVYLSGGTISSINKGNVVFTATPATIHVEPGDQFTVTYTSAPTAYKDRF